MLQLHLRLVGVQAAHRPRTPRRPRTQLVHIGKQSAGKSRLIEALAGECFNFISDSLGSRRPTVLEFRNVPSQRSSRGVCARSCPKRAGGAPSAVCDEDRGRRARGTRPDGERRALTRFRDFVLDSSKQHLAASIITLGTSFMKDRRNVWHYVKHAGDAARCRRSRGAALSTRALTARC